MFTSPMHPAIPARVVDVATLGAGVPEMQEKAMDAA
jgi:hypothetical protein